MSGSLPACGQGDVRPFGGRGMGRSPTRAVAVGWSCVPMRRGRASRLTVRGKGETGGPWRGGVRPTSCEEGWGGELLGPHLDESGTEAARPPKHAESQTNTLATGHDSVRKTHLASEKCSFTKNSEVADTTLECGRDAD